MKVKRLENKIKPEFQLKDSLQLDGTDLTDLRTLNTNIIVNLLEDTMKKREQSLNLKLKK